MGLDQIALTAAIHVLAFNMALLELLLRCFRKRKPPSEQNRPLVLSAETSGERVSSDQHVDAIEYVPQTPSGTTKPSDLEVEPEPTSQEPVLTESKQSPTVGNQLAYKQATVDSNIKTLSSPQVNHFDCSGYLTLCLSMLA